MFNSDIANFALHAVTANRLRTLLILLAMAIGVGTVIVLTALGESARRYVTNEFASLGTNLLIVLPGRTETTGGPPPLFGEVPRDLTIDDALALLHSHSINRVAPLIVGTAPVSYAGLEREVTILGTTADYAPIRHLSMALGRFLPETDPRQIVSVCVLGRKIKVELFGNANALGQWLRIGDRRFRVVGVLGKTGISIGVDIDDIAIIPVASAQILFNQPSLFRVVVEGRSSTDLPRSVSDIKQIISERHEGEDDVTVITQDSVVATFDKIFKALTYGLAGIAAISLSVAGILIMNVMLVSVTQRTTEIGLLKALGAPAWAIRRLFITEALLLSVFGGVFGVVLGVVAAEILRRTYPVLPIEPPVWAIITAFGIAIATGLVFGVLPASRAARLDPVTALSGR
ncbi:MAG: ABC transporter permease [Gammaproteobacteria bacterium]|nr:ABC transporter permease [Gammaproteobacteria bacterium]